MKGRWSGVRRRTLECIQQVQPAPASTCLLLLNNIAAPPSPCLPRARALPAPHLSTTLEYSAVS
jgi:hypothetical protein